MICERICAAAAAAIRVNQRAPFVCRRFARFEIRCLCCCVADSVADRGGVQVGDRLVTVNGVRVVTESFDAVRKIINQGRLSDFDIF